MDTSIVKPDVYDFSGKALNLPDNQIHDSIASGKATFAKGKDIPAIDPDGKPVFIPSDYAAKAFQNGFTFDPPSQQMDRMKTEAYHGPLPAAMALASGAARGATLGLSDQALTRLGVASPDELSDLQKYRPNWSLGGEAAGILADPVGIAGAIGSLGRAVTGATDARLLSGAGRLMESLGASGSPTAAKVLGAGTDIASHAIGSAVEGSLFSGVGNTISEQALGDPDLNAEKILSNFGTGAVLGGALGGAFKSLSIGLPASVKGATEGLASLRNTLIGTGENDAGLLEKVIPPGKILDAIKDRTVNVDADEAIRIVKNVSKDLNTTNKNVQTMLKDVNTDIRPQETEALINSPQVSESKVREAFDVNKNNLDKAIEVMRSEPELYPGNIARKLELERDALARGITNESSKYDLFDKLRSLKQGLQKNINFSKIPTAQEAEAVNMLNAMRGDVRDTLRDPNIFGDAGSRLAAHDDMLSRFYEFMPPGGKASEFQKDFMKRPKGGPNAQWEFDPVKVERVFKRGNTLGGQQSMERLNNFYEVLHDLPGHVKDIYENVPNSRFDPEDLKGIISKSEQNALDSHHKYLSSMNNSKNGLGLGEIVAGTMLSHHPIIAAGIEAYQIAKNPIQQMNKLALIERSAGKVTQAIGKGAMSVFEPSSSFVASKSGAISKLALENNKDSHKTTGEELKDLVNNPDKFASVLGEATKDLSEVAPNTTQGLQISASRAIQFLASKVPGPKELNPFSKPYEPSQFEISKFNQYKEVVENPLIAFKQMKLGVLGPETIETLTAVYPKIYQEMKSSVLQAAASHLGKDKTVPFQVKQQLSFFLGQPIDKALQPQNLANLQMTFQQPQSQAGTTRPSKTGMGKITLAERSSPQKRPES